MPLQKGRGRIAVGIAIACLYIFVALLSFRGALAPRRVLFDGTGPPQPYQWVTPPPQLAQYSHPASDMGTMPLSAHSPPFNLNTADAQASVIFPPDGVLAMAGQTKAQIAIKPLDPAKVAPPPAGLAYDGNAYDFEGTYLPSGKPVQLPTLKCGLTIVNACTTVVLRYAFSATGLYRLDGTTWTPIESQISKGSLQVLGNTDKLGIFVAAGPKTINRNTKPKGQAGNIIAFGIGVAAILVGTFLARVRATRRRRARDEAGQKKKGPGARQRRQRKKDDEQKPWWRD